MKQRQQVTTAYIEKFFGDTTLLRDMTNTEIRRAISELRREWIRVGDYTPGVDPTAHDIYQYAITHKS
jgi:hypothetical protein